MFAPFTHDEVESVRSIVRLDQQKNDMLLSNCSSRPLPQIRSFIRRFKRSLLDMQTPTSDIVISANEQYVNIIAGVKTKRNGRYTSKSVPNLTNNFLTTINAFPLKFRAKYMKSEENEETAKAGSSSKSTSDGLNLLAENERQQQRIPIIPYIKIKFPKACKNAKELNIGSLAALPSENEPVFVCRVIGSKIIKGIEYILVSFFQPDMNPCYVLPQNLIKLLPINEADNFMLPNTVSVDNILERLMQASYFIINLIQLQSNDLNTQKKHRFIQFKTLSCASQLIFLDYVANYKIPKEKIDIIIDSFPKISPLKYGSSEAICNRCTKLICNIISKLI